jgi:hypothetical protein
MTVTIELRPCRVATSESSEEGCLVVANDVIAALLVRLDDETAGEKGWFLQIGFGPCNEEGLLFTTLDDAGKWAAQRLEADWGKPTSPHSMGAAAVNA